MNDIPHKLGTHVVWITIRQLLVYRYFLNHFGSLFMHSSLFPPVFYLDLTCTTTAFENLLSPSPPQKEDRKQR
jgi:hypothetical protein